MITSFFAPKKKLNNKAVASKVSSPSTENEMSSSPASRGSIDDENDAHQQKKKTKTDDPVTEMLKYLDEAHANSDDGDSEGMSWRDALDKHFKSKKFETLAKFVSTQRISATVYPPPCDVFSALTLTPMDKVKVVIVGQDPYHGPNQGHGLCFSVRKGVDIPPSLKNIYKELKNDDKIDFPSNGVIPDHGHLERWARQGVLLLNAVLTVRRGEANSHKKKGWEEVTDEILKVLARSRRQSTTGKKNGLVFLLWGKPAQKKIESVLGQARSTNRVVISTSHPSPLGATKTASPFLGSKCFSRANDALVKMGLEPVDWNVDESKNEATKLLDDV